MTGFEIRTKEYDFRAAPILDGATAWYTAVVGEPLPGRFRSAMEAAREAARIEYETMMAKRFFDTARTAEVAADWTGERPSGVMSRPMPVSWRARHSRSDPFRMRLPHSRGDSSPELESTVLGAVGCAHLEGGARRQACAVMARRSVIQKKAVIAAILERVDPATGMFTAEGRGRNFAA